MIKFSEQFNQLTIQQRLAGRYTPASVCKKANNKSKRLVKAYDHHLDRMVALKHGTYNTIYHEFEVLGHLNNAYIVKAYDLLSNLDDFNNHSTDGMVIEWLKGITLAEHIRSGRYTQQDIRLVFTHLTDALIHCHNQGMAHGDVKPSNCMWNKGKLTLIDFSAAKPLGIDLTKSKNIFCTPSYASSDVLTKTTHLSTKTDWFSAAVMAHLLIERKHPFSGKPILKCAKKELKENSQWFDWRRTLKQGGISFEQWSVFLQNLN